MKNEAMKKTTVNTLTLPTALVEKLSTHYNAKNDSQAIISALTDYYLLPNKSQKLSDETLVIVLDTPEEALTHKYPVRIPAGICESLKEMTGNGSLSATATQILAQALYMKLTAATFPVSGSRLIYVSGNKRDANMQAAIRHIATTADASWEHSVETCLGSLGIFANFDFAPDKVINDNDWHKANLAKAIRDCPRKLIIEACALSVTKEIFEELRDNPSTPTSSTNIGAAAQFLYLNLNSVQGDGRSFNKKATTKKYLQRLAQIYPLHGKLQGVKIQDSDIFAILNRFRHMENTLFIVDPPYLDTRGYKNRLTRKTPSYGKEFGLEQHQKLAKLLRHIKENSHNDFIYFCRVTVTRKKDQKTKEVRQTPEELALSDRILQRKIDRLYWAHSLYYMDVPTISDGTVERIITSFSFDGAIAYGKEAE